MPKGFGGGMQNMLQQAQAMQRKMAKMQEEMAQKQVTGTAGGSAVSVVVNGKQEVLSIKIDVELAKSGDVDMLQDLVMTAVNDGLTRARDMMSEAMSQVTGGLNIPGLF